MSIKGKGTESTANIKIYWLLDTRHISYCEPDPDRSQRTTDQGPIRQNHPYGIFATTQRESHRVRPMWTHYNWKVEQYNHGKGSDISVTKKNIYL